VRFFGCVVTPSPLSSWSLLHSLLQELPCKNQQHYKGGECFVPRTKRFVPGTVCLNNSLPVLLLIVYLAEMDQCIHSSKFCTVELGEPYNFFSVYKELFAN
jgi:hypothetical protein